MSQSFKKIIDNIKKYQSWGMKLTPAQYNPNNKEKDKKPIAIKNKEGQWKWSINVEDFEWSKEELADAILNKRLAVYHKSPNARFFDLDCDDKTGRLNSYMHLLPDTFTIGKKINGITKITHKLYKLPKNKKVKNWHYDHYSEGRKAELLSSGISVIDGLDRLVIKNVEPKIIDPEEVLEQFKFANFLAEIQNYYPEKNKGRRDEAFLRIASTLAKQTKVPLEIKEKFCEQFLINVGDTDELKNRIYKLASQEKVFKENPDILMGIDALSLFLANNENLKKLDSNNKPSRIILDSFNEIKIGLKHEEPKKLKTIAYSSHDDFLVHDFPKPEYLIEPYVSKNTIVEIVGESGVGKTMWGLQIAGVLAAGGGLLDMPSCGGPVPVLYVEGELPAASIQERINGMLEKGNKKIKQNFFNVSTLQQQLAINNGGFQPIQTEEGLKAIENALFEIKNKTGQMPVVFIDNISCLAPGLQENDAHEWSPIINKFVKWKNLGSTIFYFHHLNKSKTSSGSTMQHRTIDMVIRMCKPDHKQKVKTFEDRGVQAIVDFPKWRLHDNSKYAQPHMLVCDDWNWQKLPVLKADEVEIIKMFEKGLSVKEMSEESEINEKTIYKKLKKLKDEGIISSAIDKNDIV